MVTNVYDLKSKITDFSPFFIHVSPRILVIICKTGHGHRPSMTVTLSKIKSTLPNFLFLMPNLCSWLMIFCFLLIALGSHTRNPDLTKIPLPEYLRKLLTARRGRKDGEAQNDKGAFVVLRLRQFIYPLSRTVSYDVSPAPVIPSFRLRFFRTCPDLPDFTLRSLRYLRI